MLANESVNKSLSITSHLKDNLIFYGLLKSQDNLVPIMTQNIVTQPR